MITPFDRAVVLEGVLESLNAALRADPAAISNLISQRVPCNLDPAAISNLISQRVPCNLELADHPHIEIGEQGGVHRVGPLGLLNGVLRAAGLPAVAAVIRCDDGMVMEFVSGGA